MANFALIENNVVLNIIVINDSDCSGGVFPESEPIGQAFIASLGIEGEWLQTSVEKQFRSNYAFIGATYDPELDAFIEPKPFDSWALDSDNQWSAPIPYPSDGDAYAWNEDILNWELNPNITLVTVFEDSFIDE
ncbi:MAG: hypothetical protein WAO93_08940 [Orrella sp.]